MSLVSGLIGKDTLTLVATQIWQVGTVNLLLELKAQKVTHPFSISDTRRLATKHPTKDQ